MTAYQYQPHLMPPETWTLTLSRYQRDNLLWLLNATGYRAHAVEPFHLANTGDWVGEIVNMLGKSNRGYPEQVSFSIDSSDHPNMSHEELRKAVARWR